MALVHVTLSRVRNQADTGEAMPVLASVPDDAETITSTGTSQSGSIVVPDERRSLFWTVVALEDIWVQFGSAPAAETGQGYLVPAGVMASFSAVVGHTFAVKNAA